MSRDGERLQQATRVTPETNSNRLEARGAAKRMPLAMVVSDLKDKLRINLQSCPPRTMADTHELLQGEWMPARRADQNCSTLDPRIIALSS